MTTYRWANAEQIGIIAVSDNGNLLYLDGGPEYDAAIAAGQIGPVEEVVDATPSAPDRTAMKLSFAQLLIGLVAEGWISAAEGRAWRDRTALPLPVTMLIASLPVEQQFAAETRAFAASEVVRLDPLVISLAQLQGKTDAEMDAFFLTYTAV